MATVRELLEQRTRELEQLLEQVREETQGDVDLQRLTELSDELGAKADEFAQTLTTARDALEGETQTAGEREEEGGGEEEPRADEEGGGEQEPRADEEAASHPLTEGIWQEPSRAREAAESEGEKGESSPDVG